MKKNLLLLLVACGLVLAMGGTANAAIIAEYDSGVAAAAGAGPAADPETQGWSSVNNGNGWATPLDSGNGGWRIIDGTSTSPCYYVTSIDGSLVTGDWTATWTFTSNADLINATTTLDNWVVNNNKQQNNAMWIEVAGAFRYILVVNDNAGVVQITDGTNTFDLTGHGWSHDVPTPALDFVTLTLSYDAATGTATLSEGATVYGTVATNGAASVDRVIFGAYNGAGFGSTTWNAVVVDADLNAANTPDPGNGETVVEVDLLARDVPGKVSWGAPDYTGATYNVYFGTTEPNFNDPAPYGLTQIGTTEQTETSAAPTLSLDYLTTYHWVVDAYEPNAVGTQVPTLHAGAAWSFTTVTGDAEIQQQSGGQTVEAGGTAQLSIGGINITDYEWYKDDSVTPLVNGGNIAGADSNTLTISNVQLADEGVYYCVADNGIEETPDDVFDTSLPVVVMTARLVGHWDFEASSLTDSIDGRVGVFTDPNELAPAPDPASRFVTGHLGTGAGFEFKGDNLFIEVPDNNEVLNFYPQGLTVACWMTADANSTHAYSAMVAKHTYSAPRAGWMATQASGSGQTRWNVDGAGNMNGPGAAEANVQDGDWHHVVMSFVPGYDPENPDRVGYAVYVDGGGVVFVEDVPVAMATAGYNTNPITPAELRWDVPLRIGADDEAGAGSLSGVVDEVKIWSYALTPAEVAEAYVAYTGSSVCLEPVVNDFNNDCVVDLGDLQIFAEAWLKSNIVTP